MTNWLEFNIHDRVGMRVAADSPPAPQLREMFAPFVGGGLAQHDLTITSQMEAVICESHGEHEYAYTDDALWIAALGVQILRDGSGFKLNGTRELLTTALPLVDRLMVTKDAAMVHAATVEYQGHGICMPAWGGVGKTSTVAKLLRNDDAAFMGDDWAFLSGGGDLLGYCKPMFIKPHHRPIYPHLFAEKPKPLVPSRLSKPVARMTTVVHPVVTKYPRLAAVSRKWSPEHMMVTPQQAFPTARIATSAPLDIVMFVERFDGLEARLTATDMEWMVSRIIGNFHCEMSAHSRDVVTALGATGLVPIDQLFAEKADVLVRALNGKPTFLLRVPVTFSADRASDVIVDFLHKAMADSGLS